MPPESPRQETRSVFGRRGIALLLILVYALFLGATFEASYTLPFLALSQALALGTLLVWGWHLLLRGGGLPHSPVDLGLGLLILAYLFSTLTSVDPRLSWETTMYMLLFVLLFYFFLDRFLEGWTPQFLASTLRLLSLVVIVAALVELAIWHWGIFGGAGWTETLAGLAFYRGRLVLEHANALGWFLGMMVPLWLDRWDKQASRRGKIETLFWLVLLVVVLVSTFSRAGWLAAGVGTVAWLIFNRISRLREVVFSLWRTPRRRFGMSAVLVVVILLLVLGAWTVATRIRPDSASFRIELWSLSFQLLAQRPLLGSGPGTFGLAIQSLDLPVTGGGELAIHAHNGYLNMVAETGLLGLVALLILAVQLGKAWWQLLRPQAKGSFTASDPQHSFTAFLPALIALLAANLFDTTSHFPYTTLLLALLSATLLVSLSKPRGNTSRLGFRLFPFAVSLALLVSFFWMDLAHLAQVEGLEAAHAGDLTTAERLLEAAVSADPSLRVYQLQIGVVRAQEYLEEGDRQALQEAVEIFQEQVDAGLRHVLVQSSLAWLEWYAGDSINARETMRQAISRTPLNPGLWMGLGFLEEDAGDLESAEEAYTMALALQPSLSGSAFWRISLLADERDDLLQRAMGLVPSLPRLPISQIPARQAHLAFYAGEYETARALIGQASGSTEPELVEGLLALQDGDFYAAGEAASRALALDPALGAAYLLRGRVLLAVGDLNQARGDFLTAARFGEPEGQAYIGDMLYRQGAYGEAIQAYEEGLRRPCPAPPSVYDFESNVYHRPDFLPDFTPEILRCAPGEDLLTPYLHLADAYRKVGREDDATQLLLWLDEYHLADVPG